MRLALLMVAAAVLLPAQQATPVLRFSESLRSITVYGSPSEVDSILANLQKLDVPSAAANLADRNVEMTLCLLLASNAPGAGEAVPAALEPAVRQLKATFGFKEFRLLDAAILRGRAGERSSLSGKLSLLGAKGGEDYYEAVVGRFGARKTPDSAMIRFDGFELNMRVPQCAAPECTRFSYSSVVYRTNLDIREGQFVVVGKSKLDGSDRSIVAVIAARVAD